MRKTEGMKKLLSFLLALSMVLSYVPVSGFAEEVCTHHTHDKACGYVEAVEGKSCTHQCTESCPKKDVTVCVHDHVKLGCAHTPAVEGVACDHVHGEACGYVPAQAAVPCTCGAVAAHTAQCASLVTEGAECDCGMPTLHAEGCEPKAAVAEQCSHVHGACAYKAAVQESWGCGHVCTKDSGCVKAVCAHAHDASCGYVQAVKGSDCTFVCTECKAEEKTCTCESTDPGEHAPFCDLYVRTYEECKCVLDCAVEGLNDYCETCYFEGAEACSASGEEEAVSFVQTGDTGECSWTFDENNGLLTISGNGAMGTDQPWASYKNSITTVVIDRGVTSIGNYAFSGCSNLTSVTIPGSVKTIGSSAFSGCSNLTSVTIPGSVKTIGSSAFSGCTSLESVSIPGSVVSIGSSAFSGCTSLNDVEYWGILIASAGSGVFSGCSRLSVIKVHKGYTSDSFAGMHVDPVLENSSTPDDTTYTITATADPVAGGTVTGAADYAEGTTVILTATANTGYKFVNWTENGAVVGTKPTYSFRASADRNLTAVFEAHTHNWTYAASGATITATCSNADGCCPNTNGGTISIAVPDSVTYTSNAIEAVVTDNLTPEHTVVYSGNGLVDNKPVNPGTYTAAITLDTAEISVTYTIENVLNGITITAEPTDPVAVPTKDKSKIVTLTAMADYAYGADVDVTEDATWSLAENYTGVKIEGNVITLAPEAAAGTIKATAAYGDKTDEITITLTKANAGVLNTLGEITGPDSISVTGKTEPQTGTYTITGEDAYGAAVTPDVEWSVAGHDDVTIANNGELTVPLNVPNGVKLTITATSGNLTKSKEINIIAHTHEWDFRLKENTTDTIEAFCKNTDGGHDDTNGGSVKISATGGEYNGTSYTAQTVAHEAWKGEDVTISYYKKNASDTYELVTEQKNAGSYKAAITVKNAAAEDVTAFVLFDVTPKALTIQEVTATDRVYALDNTEVSVNVVLDGIVSTDNITATATGTLVDANAGTDKTVSVTITLSGVDVNNYSCPATATTTVSIQPRSLNADGITATLSDNLIFEGAAIPALTIKDGNITLTKDTDYTVTQTGNEGLFTLTVEGKGNYKDAYSGTLTYLVVTMPDPDKVEPDDKDAIDAYDRYSKLNETYKDAELTEALKELKEALTAYDVIKGHKSSYTRGSGKTFSLTANGYFGKFTGLKIDGRILDSKYYTAKSGSTIVTLKNSYLDSLSDGKHTVEFLYTDGSTGGDHYFRISTNNGSPFTGDNNHIMMFRGIMMTSLLCMAMMIMFIPRKKGKYQR